MFIRLHNITIEISLDPDAFWEFWRWKLDPFQTSEDIAAPDVHIDLTGYNSRCDNLRVDNPGAEILSTENFSLIHHEKVGFFSYNTYRAPDDTLFWSMDRPAKKRRILSYSISPDWTMIRLIEDYSKTNGQLAFELLIQLLPVIFLKHFSIQLHGVLLEDAGKGIIICADSGTGKTTHARMWRDTRNAFIIDGDRATCVKEGSRWLAFGIPWCGSSGEYMNRTVPIKAIVVLDRGDENKACRITGIESFLRVMPHLQYPEWDLGLSRKAMDLMQNLTEEIPVIHLLCRPDPEAVDTLEQLLAELYLESRFQNGNHKQ